MTRGSIQECTEAVRGRYLQAKKKEKSQVLDEFTRVIGCHRKAAIRLLHRGNQPMSNKKRGRPRQYGTTVARALDSDNGTEFINHHLYPSIGRTISGIGLPSPGLVPTRRMIAVMWSKRTGGNLLWY